MPTINCYSQYFEALLQGKRKICQDIVIEHLKNKIEIRQLYQDLFQKSLYEVGNLWEKNKISVAKEHLATAITEYMLTQTYPYLTINNAQPQQKVIIACTPNEYHQIGGKMVADIFELNGWQAYFLGASTPVSDLIQCIDEIKPEVLGLSLALYSNLIFLTKILETINSTFSNLQIIVGGQAFRWGGLSVLNSFKNTDFVANLDDVEKLCRKHAS